MDLGIQWYLILLPQHVSIVTSVLIFDIFPMRLSLIIMLSFFQIWLNKALSIANSLC